MSLKSVSNIDPPVLVGIALTLQEVLRLPAGRARDRLAQKLAEAASVAPAAAEPNLAEEEAREAIEDFESSGAPAWYISHVRGFLASLGNIPVSAIEAKDVAAWLDARRDAGQQRAAFTPVKQFLDLLDRTDITSMVSRGTRDEWPEVLLTRPRTPYKVQRRRADGTDEEVEIVADEDDPPTESVVPEYAPVGGGATCGSLSAPANADLAMEGVEDALAPMWDAVAA